MKISPQFWILPLSLSLLSACGGNGLDFIQESSSFSQSTAPDSGCHPWDAPNITPIEDTTHDGSRAYSTCFDPTTPSEVLIRGHSSRSAWVCAYPVQITGPSSLQAASDAQGVPLSQCWDASQSGDAGISLNFSLRGFNGLVIIEMTQRLNMTRCLASGATCPIDYSVGAL